MIKNTTAKEKKIRTLLSKFLPKRSYRNIAINTVNAINGEIMNFPRGLFSSKLHYPYRTL